MTESQRATIQECIDATRTHFQVLTTVREPEALDDVEEGLAITESKLQALLDDDTVDITRGISTRSSTLARILRAIRRRANYEDANFHEFVVHGSVGVRNPHADLADIRTLVMTPGAITGSIKETTFEYRESWINPLIDGLIAWTEGKADIRQIEKDLL